MLTLTPEKATIFRITHINNVKWILKYGLHCCKSKVRDPNFRVIGDPDLITKRTSASVPVSPGGTLADYVPFYFTPHSVMLYCILTGHNVRKVPMSEIVFLASSVHKLKRDGRRFVFTDVHAYFAHTRRRRFYTRVDDLDKIDWPVIQSRNFRKDLNDPERCERYQAEALVHGHLPADELIAIGCHGTDEVKTVEGWTKGNGCEVRVVHRPGWYF